MSSSDSGSEDEQLADQQITGANADPQVLQYFWDLASLEQDARETAASALVSALLDSQHQHDADSESISAQPNGSLEQQDAGNRQQRMEQCLNCCSPVMAYGLKRLSRGLASSRQGARQGFAAALAATLAHAAAAAEKQSNSLKRPFISAAGVLTMLEACLEVTGSMSGADQRDALLGRVFGLAALIRSGLVMAYPASDVDHGSVRGVAAVAEQLVGLMQRKSFLRESAAAALVELLQSLEQQQMQQVLSQSPKLSSLLQTRAAAAAPELLFISLRLWHNLPQQQLQSSQLLPLLPAAASPPPQQFWQQPSAVPRSAVAAAAAAVFSAAHVQLLVPCLLLSSASHPRLHPVWGCLLALLVPGFVPVKVQQQQETDLQPEQQQQQRAAPDALQLSNLWQQFVEGGCFSSSHERKALALQLLQLLLPVMTPDTVPVLLSKQLLGCLATASRNKDSYLHAAAKKCMDRLNTAAEHNLIIKDNPSLAAKLRLSLAAALQAANLGQTSSSSKSSKAQLLSGMDAAGVAVYVEQLLQEFVTAAAAAADRDDHDDQGSDDDHDDQLGTDVDDVKAKQLLDQLSAALRFPATDQQTLWKGLLFLAATAFLRLSKAVDISGLKTTAADGLGAAAAAATTKKSKKGKGSKEIEAAVDNSDMQQQQVLQLAASIQPQPSAAVRQHCAAKLITLLHSLQHRTGQQQQQKGSKDSASAAADGKQQKKAQREKEHEQAAAAKAAAWQQQEILITQLLHLVSTMQQLPGVEPSSDEDVIEMVQQLQQLEAAVSEHGKQQQQQGGIAAASSTNMTRRRMCIQLIQQLQLQLLAGGLSAEAAGSVVDDLEVAVVRGLGMPTEGLGIDRSAADLSSDDDQDVDDESSDGEEESPAWQDVLLDLLLALLSSSSDAAAAKGGVLVSTAPLREACEAVFRVFAEDITAQGLSDMIRVLSQRASEITKPRDDEDDEMEMEVDQSGSDDDDHDGDDASDEDLGSDDERLAELGDLQNAQQEDLDDSDGDQSEDDDQQQPASNAAAGNGSSDPAAVPGGDDDDSDLDDLDDEAMLAMDAQLGAAVRSMLQRSGGSAKERAAALLNHQLRVAALMEEWLKKCPKSPLVLQIILPLLQAVITARGAGGNPTLADRLTSLVTKQLSRCRPSLPAAAAAGDNAAAADSNSQQQWNLQVYEADTRKVLYHASRERDPRVAAAAAQALLVLLAAGAEAGGAAAAAAQAAAAAAFADFFEKKKTRLQKQWCEQLLTRCPEAVAAGEAAALKTLLTAISKPRNESTRSKAVLLLPVLFRSGQPQQQQAALVALQQHQSLLASALGAAVAGPYKSKDQHAAAVKSVVQLLQSVVKVGGSGKRLADLLGGEAVRELGKMVVVVKAAGVAPRVESQLDRLVDAAQLQQLVAANKPDPARLAMLKKARAALEGKGAAAAGGDQAGQQQQQDAAQDNTQRHKKDTQKEKKEKKDGEGKGKKRKQQQQQLNGGGAAPEGSKVKKHKKQHQSDITPAAGKGEIAGKKHKKEQKEGKGSKKHKQH